MSLKFALGHPPSPPSGPRQVVQGNGILLLVNQVNSRLQRPSTRFLSWTFPEPARRRRPGCMVYGTYPGPQESRRAGGVLGRPPDRARRGLMVDGYLSALRKSANRARLPLSYVPFRGQLAGTHP